MSINQSASTLSEGGLIERLLRRPLSIGLALVSAACSVGTVGGAPGSSGAPGPAGSLSGSSAAAGSGGGSGAGSSGASGMQTASADGGVVWAADAAAPAVVLSPSSRVARLSHTQLVNTYRDLLGLSDVSAADTTLTLDAVVGFDNEANSLFVTDQLWSNLQALAEQYAHTVATNPTALAQLVPANSPTDPTGKATAFIQSLGLRAYRRPLLAAEVQDCLTLFNQGPNLIGGTDAFAAGAELVLQLFLQSPYFLYRTELSDAIVGDRIPLDDYEVASKVSYALTNTMPDATLFDAAAQGKVADPADLAAQATRLLATPAATAAEEHFHFQMYRLGVYDGIVKDPTVYPQFTSAVGPAMRQEGLLFLDWIFASGKGVADIYTSPVSFVNNLLAPTYALKGSFTSAFQEVTLDPTQRAGLLTQLGFLASEATANDVDTIHRGVFINTRILCAVLPPPSPLARPLPVTTANLPDRARIDSFTGKGTCAESCHATILNPPGFAFENYDSIGAYRLTDQGQPVNAADTFVFNPGDAPTSFDNAIDFESDLAKSRQSHTCYVQNWASYLYARSVVNVTTGFLLPADAPTVDYLAQESLSNGLPVKSLVLSMSTNDTFLFRSPQVN
jgi:hypothetical protein